MVNKLNIKTEAVTGIKESPLRPAPKPVTIQFNERDIPKKTASLILITPFALRSAFEESLSVSIMMRSILDRV